MAVYTVREMAEKLGVTPQGVNKFLRTSGLREQCQKNGNRFLIPETVQKQLETHFAETPVKSETKSETDGNPETKSETVSVPWEVYEDLRKQLAIKDEQIRELGAALINAQEQAKAAQLLHAADRKDDLLPAAASAEEPARRRGFWSRIFGEPA